MPETAASTEFGPRKTVVILAIVAGCFAVLLPKIFYPMLTASLTPSEVHHADGSVGCCDVIFESDVTAVDIMQELCLNIIKHHQVDPRVRGALGVSKFNKLTPSSASLCREEVLVKCGIDLSSFLAEKERLKKSYKQVLEEVRGFNSSLCLKMQFGVPRARLGTPHLIRYHILMPHSPIRQERQTPPHAGNYHPALRERGRAIPSSHIVPKIQDRPNHMAPPMKMRPPMGGAGHVVAAPKGNGFVGLLMPLYTIGIVIFFLYTLTKVLMRIFMPIYTIGNIVSFLYKVLQVLRKSSDSEIIRPEYSTAGAEKEYQKIVFNPEIFAAAVTAVNGAQYEQNMHSATLGEDEQAPTIEELKEHQSPKSNGLAAGVNPNSKDSNVSEDQNDAELEEFCEATPTVKVVNMEMTATCEGGQRYSRPTTPTLLASHSHQEEKEKSPPISIYLEGALPPQCELLVTDSKTQELLVEESMEVPVVLSGKMTLSLISLDQESQDELDSETPQYRTPIRYERSSNYTDESVAQLKADSSNKKIKVLQQEFLDKKENCQSDNEEDEVEEVDELSKEGSIKNNLLLPNRQLPHNPQGKKNHQTLEQNYNQNLSESFESDEESDGAVNQNCGKKELEKRTVNQSSETEDEEDEEEENEVNHGEEIDQEGEKSYEEAEGNSEEESEEYSEEENEEYSEEENEEYSEEENEETPEEEHDEYEDSSDEENEDEEEEENEDEEDEEDNNGEINKLNFLQSGSDDEYEEENRKTQLNKPLGEKKTN